MGLGALKNPLMIVCQLIATNLAAIATFENQRQERILSLDEPMGDEIKMSSERVLEDAWRGLPKLSRVIYLQWNSGLKMSVFSDKEENWNSFEKGKINFLFQNYIINQFKFLLKKTTNL